MAMLGIAVALVSRERKRAREIAGVPLATMCLSDKPGQTSSHSVRERANDCNSNDFMSLHLPTF